MCPRLLLLGTGIWALAYASVYVWLIRSQHDSGIVWWYLALILLGAGLALVAATKRRRRESIAALVGLSVAALLGILSIGVLLLPAVAGLAFAARSPAGVRVR